MKILIDGQKVTRTGFDTPTKEEVTRVTDLLKQNFQLGWAGVAALFGMLPTTGNAMNIKKMRVGQKPMPIAHYLTALSLLGELNIEIIEVNNGIDHHERD